MCAIRPFFFKKNIIENGVIKTIPKFKLQGKNTLWKARNRALLVFFKFSHFWKFSLEVNKVNQTSNCWKECFWENTKRKFFWFSRKADQDISLGKYEIWHPDNLQNIKNVGVWLGRPEEMAADLTVTKQEFSWLSKYAHRTTHSLLNFWLFVISFIVPGNQSKMSTYA